MKKPLIITAIIATTISIGYVGIYQPRSTPTSAPNMGGGETFNPNSPAGRIDSALQEMQQEAETLMGKADGNAALSTISATAKPAMAGGVGAAFVSLHNKGDAVATIVSAQSPVAGRIEFHTHVMEDGIARMRPIPSLVVPAGGEVQMKSGGVHIMLFDLTEGLESGQQFPISFLLHDGSQFDVDVMVD